MLFIDNKGINDPAFNLALEEYALRQLNLREGCLLFYINEPSIIIGKNQNTIEEIHSEYVQKNGIHIVRRLSGGGAVYHDLGNLNFSILTLDDGKSFLNFAKFTQPVIDVLQSLGVNAELTGRNDIQVGEQKISGNAQFATRGRMYSHGTLLFNSAMDNVSSALNIKPMKIESKSTKSVRSRVANIVDFLQRPMTIEQFRTALLEHIFNCPAAEVPEYPLTDSDWEAVHKLADEKYRSWDWNYGRSPASNIQNAHKFTSGIVDVRLQVEEGRLKEIKIYGDFFGVLDVAELEEILAGVRYDETSIHQALAEIDLNRYFGKMSEPEFLALLLIKEIGA
jgi:lipoate-protein ligase A